MNKKYAGRLKKSERKKLNELTRKGSEKARKLRRCQILLLSDGGKVDAEIAKVLKISLGTVANIRKRYKQGGLELALNEKRRLGAPRKFHERHRAKITALACSKPPEGHSQWSLRLLADKAVELELVNEISHIAVHRILKNEVNFHGLTPVAFLESKLRLPLALSSLGTTSSTGSRP